jgi:PA14 domain/Fibronectin type III domain
MVRNDGIGFLNFDWGLGGPDSDCLLGVDNFSARWTRKVNFVDTGKYRFTVIGDDGVRLWVGGLLKIDQWIFQAPTTYKADVDLIASNHDLKLEYFEGGGPGVTHLSWGLLPFAPSNLGATPLSASQILLNWTKNGGNESWFSIERWNGSSFVEVATVGANPPSYVDPGLAPSTTYWYRVRAFNSTGESPYSNQIGATTLLVGPSNLVTTGFTQRVSLSWAYNGDFEDGFKIERWIGGGFTQIATVGPNVTSYTEFSLNHSTTYTYRVRAFNSAGDSAYSNESTATTSPCPPNPSVPPCAVTRTCGTCNPVWNTTLCQWVCS